MTRCAFAALALVALPAVASAQGIPTVSPSGQQPDPAPNPTPSPTNIYAPAQNGQPTAQPPVPGQPATGEPGEGATGYYYTDDYGDDVEADDGDVITVHGAQPPAVHVVRRGDTLWDICFYYFQNPWEWPRIWSYNPQIANPHWIYPGDNVKLYAEGAAPAPPVVEEPDEGGDIEPILAPAPAPRSGVELRQLAFVSLEDLKVAGVVVGSTEEKMLLASGDPIYIDYPNGKPPQVQKRYAVYSPTRDVYHPETGNKIGTYVLLKGEVEIRSVKKDKRARGVVTYSTDVMERGDRVGNMLTQFKDVKPVAADRDLEGVIVAAIGTDKIVGTRQIVIVDRGADDGVKRGNRFRVVRRGDAYVQELGPGGTSVAINDQRYPDESLAVLIVVEVGKKTSVALVDTARQEVEVGDHAVMRKGR